MKNMFYFVTCFAVVVAFRNVCNYHKGKGPHLFKKKKGSKITIALFIQTNQPAVNDFGTECTQVVFCISIPFEGERIKEL